MGTIVDTMAAVKFLIALACIQVKPTADRGGRTNE